MGLEPVRPIFDNICTLPLLSSDISTQALHPTEPILVVGLSAGHVQAYILPPGPNQTVSSKNGKGINTHTKGSVIRGRRNSETGFDFIDTAWRTRRHKGSCRALAFSTDGGKIYSSGTDGVVKVAESETGTVTSKFVLPQYSQHTFDTPTVLHTLSPQSLLLGTDYGSVHMYDIREPSSELTARPSQSLRPHYNKENPSNASEESITSITPLPPTTASTSGTSRSWISTSLNTLAFSDLRKGVVTLSQDQGDLCLSSTCVVGNGVSHKRKSDGEVGNGEKVIIGSEGVLTVWERGSWVDQSGRIQVYKESGGQGGFDMGTVDCLTTVPGDVKFSGKAAGAGIVVAGLGNGVIQFVKIKGRGGEVVGSLGHDELSFEGVTTLGFDVTGRMVSGGGQIVKIWHEVNEQEAESGEEEQGELEEEEVDGSSDAEDEGESSSDEEPEQVVKKPKKNKAMYSKHGAHGVLAFSGMD